MDRDLLIHLPVILTVARRAGFAAAASELGMSPSAVSHAVRLVEERLGVPLFARTTRSVALTEAGRALVEAAAPALRDIGERVERIRAAKGRVGGLLRLNVPNAALPILTPVVGAMAKRFPGVTVEIYADDAIVDIVAAGFDAGARLGEMIAEDMVATRLTPPFAAIIVASPAYLAARGRPKGIADLKDHNCIAYRMITGGGLYRWELVDGEREVTVEGAGSTIVNHTLYARDLALAGVGLAYLFEPLVRADIAAGRLTQVLPETAQEEPGLFLYYPKRAALAPKLRAFIDTAREILRERE
ncbi:LysR family transcriptional regulator [Shumkonia mesophila]|uniref:LysR family transcriptional regulator n=1 Tax=Shumkonia mesophila TaxID=2838854 RepID=UPI0029342071|nr:LysR family transcriptional regulator [Shumkonia mesophila]